MNPTVRLALMATGLGSVIISGLVLLETGVTWEVRAVGAATLFLSLAPGLKYLAESPRGRRPVPFLPVVGLIYGLYFGRSFAFGFPANVSGVRVETGAALLGPALLALVGWGVLLGGYWTFGRIHRPRRWDLSRVADPRALRRAGVVLATLGLGLESTHYFIPIPTVLAGAWSLLGRLGWVGAGFLVASWASGELGRSTKVFTVVAVVAISALEIATGTVAKPGRFWLLLLLAVWLGRGRTASAGWWLAGVAVVLTMVMLRAGAGDYRQQAWYGADLGPLEELATYSSVVERSFRRGGVDLLFRRGIKVAGERSSQAAVLADVVQRTPRAVPYWKGETYVSLVGAFVPRFLWPSKPVKNLGQRFGHRYSYLAPDDRHTSFNLPFLVEFYANFGSLGVLFGMAVVGIIYRLLNDLLNQRSSRNRVASVLALGLLVPIMTGLESDFSLVFGGLFLNGVILFAILRLLTRRPTGARSLRSRVEV